MTTDVASNGSEVGAPLMDDEGPADWNSLAPPKYDERWLAEQPPLYSSCVQESSETLSSQPEVAQVHSITDWRRSSGSNSAASNGYVQDNHSHNSRLDLPYDHHDRYPRPIADTPVPNAAILPLYQHSRQPRRQHHPQCQQPQPQRQLLPQTSSSDDEHSGTYTWQLMLGCCVMIFCGCPCGFIALCLACCASCTDDPNNAKTLAEASVTFSASGIICGLGFSLVVFILSRF